MALASTLSEKPAKTASTTSTGGTAAKPPGQQNGNGAGKGGGSGKISFVARIRRKLNFSSKTSQNSNRNGAGETSSAPPTSAGLPPTAQSEVTGTEEQKRAGSEPTSPVSPTSPTSPGSERRTNARRPVVPGLPRQQTLARQMSEMRTRLKPVQDPRSSSRDRRGSGADGRASSRSLQPIQSHSKSSVGIDDPERRQSDPAAAPAAPESGILEGAQESPESETQPRQKPVFPAGPKESEPQIISADESAISDSEDDDGVSTINGTPSAGIEQSPRHEGIVSPEIEEEMEWKWILNLSMHFRDESNREKFFVTYAPRRNEQRRITISCDYRNAGEGTLEREISALRFQRDKSAKIYEAIRDSLQDIRFYDTITNLKLQTSDGRLHVHVTEDVNEIIQFPPIHAISHLRCAKYRESEIDFDSHLSGFVYKVSVNGEIMIKKEIPGPDTVDEFLYEINALYALADSDNVIHFKGCVVDDRRERIKGLLISFAPKGALIDILFNERGKLPWTTRERWAKQIVTGLSDIHEAGYVQGDFTLSNMVIDEKDNAQIIDINRRGCPVGWEPPEVSVMLNGPQRIGMYIGVKSDIFQLGMVLWGIAHENDEPEQMPRPLTMDQAPDDVPAYFRDIVEACLCDRPQGRPSAKDIIAMFPEHVSDPPEMVYNPGYAGRPIPSVHNSANGYFPPTLGHQSPTLAAHHRGLEASPPPSDDEFVSPPPTIHRMPSAVSDSSIGGGVAVRGSRAQSPRYPGPGDQNVFRHSMSKGYRDDDTATTATTTDASLYDDTTEDGRDTPTAARGRWVDAKESLSPTQTPAF